MNGETNRWTMVGSFREPINQPTSQLKKKTHLNVSIHNHHHHHHHPHFWTIAKNPQLNHLMAAFIIARKTSRFQSIEWYSSTYRCTRSRIDQCGTPRGNTVEPRGPTVVFLGEGCCGKFVCRAECELTIVNTKLFEIGEVWVSMKLVQLKIILLVDPGRLAILKEWFHWTRWPFCSYLRPEVYPISFT